MKGIKKSIPEESPTPMIDAAEMFLKMEQQRVLAQTMKKRALQMYEDALVMAEKCRSRVRIK